MDFLLQISADDMMRSSVTTPEGETFWFPDAGRALSWLAIRLGYGYEDLRDYQDKGGA